MLLHMLLHEYRCNCLVRTTLSNRGHILRRSLLDISFSVLVNWTVGHTQVVASIIGHMISHVMQSDRLGIQLYHLPLN